MIKIGDLAKLSGVTVKAIRFYEKISLEYKKAKSMEKEIKAIVLAAGKGKRRRIALWSACL